MGHLSQLAVDAEGVDARLQLGVELHLQLLLRLLDLLLHEVRSLGLELRLDLLADLLSLLFPLKRRLVVLLDHAKFHLQLFLGLDLLEHASFTLLDLLGNSLLLRETPNREMAALATRL